jgi:heat shock protein HslJ
VKIRVILIICFFSVPFFLSAQKAAIKDNTIYFLSDIYNSGKKIAQVKDKGHIVFDLKLRTAACFTSCNFIRLKYDLKGTVLSFTSIEPDKEACPESMTVLEESFKTNFPKVTAYQLKGKDLYLMHNKDTLMVFSERQTGASK